MGKIIAALLLAAALSGCDSGPFVQWEPDQELRAELFKSCLASVPKGPDKTVYNDWAEVVAECESSAYYQSLRKVQ